jgi:UDP-glucose-4-epimerase GalE
MILVTGGAGYVGSHYLLLERARGREAVVIDNLCRGHREAVLDSPLVVADVADRTALDQIFTTHEIEGVVHFAAFAYVGESVFEPGPYHRNNVIGMLTLLEAMRDHGCDKLVFSSSCATFGDPVYLPIDEKHTQIPINPYGDSKVACERMIAGFARAHGLRWVALRYFNAAGSDPDARIGESHDPETHLIPLALQVAAGGRESITINGVDWDTPDGTCIRDYVHVLDLVDAHARALDHLLDGGGSLALNLGSESGHSVREVIRACEQAAGRPIRTIDGPRRPGDPARLVATAAGAQAALGWSPRRSALDHAVATAWRWMQEKRY